MAETQNISPLPDPGFSLAPRNSTPLERALYESVTALFNNIELPIDTLLDPYTCPVQTLPLLAWMVNVDLWDSEWTETIKRDVIATSIKTHRFKGTVGAIKSALAAVGVNAEIVEWHQQNPVGTKGTFKIIASANSNISTDPNEPLLNPERLNRLNELVTRVKRLSQHHTIELRSAHNAKVGVAALARVSSRVAVRGVTKIIFRSTSSIRTAAIIQAHTNVRAQGIMS